MIYRLYLPPLSFFFWMILFTAPNGYAQVEFGVPAPEISYSQQTDERLPYARFIWKNQSLPNRQKMLEDDAEKVLTISELAPFPFTGIAIGWEAEGEDLLPRHFQPEVRSRVKDGEWSRWTPAPGYLTPEDSPSGLFWATLYVTADGKAHDEFEIRFYVPGKTAISFLTISAADARFDGEPSKEKFRGEINTDMPDIHPRSNWWGSLPPDELEPDYTPTRIDISHALVHHTVTANEPPDPGQVIRQIWDWHVNDNGWADIGYNFLIDHHGNLYQGRYNPWLESLDVQGAHAGRANSRSAGIALIGQFEPGAQPQFGDPSAAALNGLAKLISWRFSQNNIDPFDEEWLASDAYGTAEIPVISGHRDVSSTACPGDNLYNLLYQVRDDTEEKMDDEEEIAGLPFELGQNYPNPFREQTSIPFTLDEQSDVNLTLYDIKGRKLREIYSENNVQSGSHEISFEADGLSSGAYFYELTAQEFRQMKLMVFIR